MAASRDAAARPAADPDALVFHYPTGEEALAAIKQAVREHRNCTFARRILPDGTDCFELFEGGKVIERHIVKKTP
jgi:hypothetical protein